MGRDTGGVEREGGLVCVQDAGSSAGSGGPSAAGSRGPDKGFIN